MAWLRIFQPCLKVSYRHNIRALHLLHHMFTKRSVGQLETVTKKGLPSANKISFQLLRSGESGKAEFEHVTLADALGRITTPAQLDKVKDNLYRLKPLKIQTRSFGDQIEKKMEPKKIKEFKRAGRGKEFHLTTDDDPAHLTHVLSKSHDFLLSGARVEFHLRQKSRGNDAKSVDWALTNNLQLRPDSVLASMPKGSTMLAQPCTSPDDRFGSLIWAVEYAPSLLKDGVETPTRIQKMGEWKQKPTVPAELDDTDEPKDNQIQAISKHSPVTN